MKNRLLLVLIFISLPVFLFAGTFFEDEKKTSDPYVADRGGFNSLFVNPAGAAGQSGFELSVSGGFRSTPNDIKLISAMAEMATSWGDGVDIASIADVGQTLSDLYDSGIINDALLDSIFGGTTLDSGSVDWSDPVAVQAAAENLDTTPGGDLDAIQANADAIAQGTNVPFKTALGTLEGEVSVELLASLKSGFLIKGFGLGIYDQAVAVGIMDPITQEYGVQTIYNELGVIAGGGFNVFDGKLALGITGNYGMLTRNSDLILMDNIDAIFSGSVNYGYNWGVDLGAIWRPTPSLGIGVVFNDVIGYTESSMPHVAVGGYEEIFNSTAFLLEDLDYEFTMDIDAGISWQPDWRLFRPKFSFDIYNMIGYARDVRDNGEDFPAAMDRSLEHIRVGANFTFFKFLNVGGQYYNHYFSVGAGLDLLFLELYGDFKIHETAIGISDIGDIPIGADLMVRLHF